MTSSPVILWSAEMIYNPVDADDRCINLQKHQNDASAKTDASANANASPNANAKTAAADFD